MLKEPHYLKQELYQLIREDASVFDFIQDSALDGLWYWDLEHPDQEWMNPRFWKVLGYDPEQMSHTPSAWQSLIDPEDMKEAMELVQRHLANPQVPYDQVLRYTHREGHTVWIRCRGMAIRDEQGRPIRMMGVHTDVTNSKQAEQQARSEAAAMASILENYATYIVKVTPTGQYLYANQVYCQTFHCSKERIVQASFLEFLSEQDQAICVAAFERCSIEQANPKDIVLTSHLPDGTTRIISWEFKMHPGPDGQKTEILCVGVDITEKRTIEHNLNIFTALLNDAQQIANVGGWDLDLATGHTIWTEQVYAIHEVEPGFDHNKTNGLEFYHPDGQHIIIGAMEKTIQTLEPFDITCRFITAKGNLRWVRVSGRPVLVNGVISRMVGAIQDVTQNELDKETIRREQQFSRQLLENMADGFSLVSPEGIQSGANHAFCQMTGFNLDELVGQKPPFPYWPPEQIPTIQKAFEETLSNKLGTFELIFRRKNNERFHVLVTPGMLKDDEGNVLSFFANTKDISELKKVENALRKSEEKFRFIAEYTSDGIIVFEYGIPTYVSPAYEKIMGYKAEEEKSRSRQEIMNLIHPDDRAYIGQLVDRNVGERVSFFSYAYRILHKQGHYIWREDRASILYDEAGVPIKSVIVATDISERMCAQLELERTKEMLAQTNEVAQVGGWELDLITQKIIWSALTKKIHEVPDDYEPNLQTAIHFYKEGESRQAITQAVDNLIKNGTPYDLELMLVTATGKELWVRTQGTGEFKNGICK